MRMMMMTMTTMPMMMMVGMRRMRRRRRRTLMMKMRMMTMLLMRRRLMTLMMRGRRRITTMTTSLIDHILQKELLSLPDGFVFASAAFFCDVQARATRFSPWRTSSGKVISRRLRGLPYRFLGAPLQTIF